MGKLRYIFVLLVVLALAFFTRWLLRSVEKPYQRVPAEARHDPDYFVTDFQTTIYDAVGQANYHLEAIRMVHFPDDNTHVLTQPRFTYIAQRDAPWVARSVSGTVYQNLDLIDMHGAVTIEQLDKTLAQPLKLETEDLRIDLEKKTADTAAHVKITGTNSIVTATGMHVDMDKRRVILKSKAEGHYAPK